MLTDEAKGLTKDSGLSQSLDDRLQGRTGGNISWPFWTAVVQTISDKTLPREQGSVLLSPSEACHGKFASAS